jgi:hypothetical protein
MGILAFSVPIRFMIQITVFACCLRLLRVGLSFFIIVVSFVAEFASTLGRRPLHYIKKNARFNGFTSESERGWRVALEFSELVQSSQVCAIEQEQF